MKTITLKVADRKTKREPAKVPLQVAENLTDVTTLARGNETVAVRCFNRGWRIENQERSGARGAYAEGKPDEEIAKIVSGYDPTAVAVRTGGGRKKEIVLPKGKKTFSAADLRALLEAQGIKVTDEAEPVPA